MVEEICIYDELQCDEEWYVLLYDASFVIRVSLVCLLRYERSNQGQGA